MINKTAINSKEENLVLSMNDEFLYFLKNLMMRNNKEILENVMKIIYNLCIDSTNFIYKMLNNDIFDIYLKQFISLYKVPSNVYLDGMSKDRTLSFIDTNYFDNFFDISDLIIKLDSLPDMSKIEKMLELVCEIINLEKEPIQKECLWILFHFSNKFAEKNKVANQTSIYDCIIQYFIRINLYQTLISLNYKNNQVKLELILNFIKNTTTDNPGIIYHLLDLQILDYLSMILIENENFQIFELIIKILINFGDATDSHKHQIITSDLMNKIFERFNTRRRIEMKIKAEMVKLIEKFCRDCKFGNAAGLVKLNIFQVAIQFLEDYMDTNTIYTILKSLKFIFTSSLPLLELSKGGNNFIYKFDYLGGFLCLEKLINHPNPDIYKEINTIFMLKDRLKY